MKIESRQPGKSTTVRSKGPPARPMPVPRLLGLATGLLARVTPGLASRLALRLFAWPPRRGPHPRAARLFATGAQIRVPVAGAHPGWVTAWRFGAGPAVVLQHGWGGNSHQMAAFVAPLVDAGLAVLAFDAPAHGGSPSLHGRRRMATLVDFALALRAVMQLAGEVRGVVAHSLGAASTLMAVASSSEPPRIVLVAHVVHLAAHFSSFLRALNLPASLQALMPARAESTYGVTWDELDVLVRAARTRGPALIQHDQDDDRVPLEDARTLTAAFPDGRLMVTSGLGHNRILRAPIVVERTVDFLTTPATRPGEET